MTPPDDPALLEAYRKYFPIIRAKCGRMLGDRAEAEDLAQETFVRLWNSDIGRDPATVAAWIYRTATRMAVDRLRHRAVVRRLSEPPRPAADPSGAVEARQILAALAKRVDPPCLTAAVLHRLDGLTHRKVGEVMDVSERSVRRLLERFDAHAARLHPTRRAP